MFAAKTAGSWGNGLRVCVVDNGPRQSIALTSGDSAINNVSVGDYVVSGSKKGKVIDYTMVMDGGVTTHYVHVVIVDNTTNAYLENPGAGQLFAAADSLTIGSNSGTAASVDDGSIWWSYAKLYSGSNLYWNTVAARPVNTADMMVEDHKVDLTTIRIFLQMVVHTSMQVIQFTKQTLEHKILNQ